MKDIFLDLSLGTGGSGTASDPFGSIESVNWSNDLRLRFRRGKIHKLVSSYFGGLTVPGSVSGGIEITDYGDAEGRAILDGSREYTEWTKYAGDIWYARVSDARHGVVMQDRVALKWVNGKGGIGSIAPRMTPGSYAHDHNGAVYVWCRNNANPNNASVRIEVAITPLGIWVGGRPTQFNGLVVSNLRLTGFSRQGCNIENVSNAQFIDNEVQYTGGDWDPAGGYYVGGGLQCGGGSRNILYERNVCTDVFDSPMSPQVYVANTSIDGVTYRRNVLGNFALGGIEIACWSAGCSIRNIVIEDNYIFGGGGGFSGIGDNIDNTEGVIINGLPGISNVTITGNVIEDIDHSGIEVRDPDNASNIVLTRNKISRCRFGIRNFTGNPTTQQVTASFNEISDCSQYGILHSQRAGKALCQYRKNTLVNNGIANLAMLNVATVAPVVRDNNCFGAQYGIQKTGSVDVAVKNNNAFGASRQNYAGVIADGTNLSVDPGFQKAAAGDYQITRTSTLVDAGSGTSSGLDLIGQPYKTDDIGCYAAISNSDALSGRVDLEALTA
jgi:hypothetical protein